MAGNNRWSTEGKTAEEIEALEQRWGGVSEPTAISPTDQTYMDSLLNQYKISQREPDDSPRSILDSWAEWAQSYLPEQQTIDLSWLFEPKAQDEMNRLLKAQDEMNRLHEINKFNQGQQERRDAFRHYLNK